jgi:hypothetical protein
MAAQRGIGLILEVNLVGVVGIVLAAVTLRRL